LLELELELSLLLLFEPVFIVPPKLLPIPPIEVIAVIEFKFKTVLIMFVAKFVDKKK
jgi:hypothetical protein